MNTTVIHIIPFGDPSFEHEADGHTYWHTPHGWAGAPLHTDGSPDMESAGYVTDYRENLSAKDYEDLTAWIARQSKAANITVHAHAKTVGRV
jgi:hypothetical protein